MTTALNLNDSPPGEGHPFWANHKPLTGLGTPEAKVTGCIILWCLLNMPRPSSQLTQEARSLIIGIMNDKFPMALSSGKYRNIQYLITIATERYHDAFRPEVKRLLLL